MKIRLQEIEFGTNDPEGSKHFYHSILGLDLSVDQAELNVFNSGVVGVDFNTSSHIPTKTTVTSFLTDDLQIVTKRLSVNGIVFSGPKKSHLGMLAIEFNDPDGHIIRVNQPTNESPQWLKI